MKVRGEDENQDTVSAINFKPKIEPLPSSSADGAENAKSHGEAKPHSQTIYKRGKSIVFARECCSSEYNTVDNYQGMKIPKVRKRVHMPASPNLLSLRRGYDHDKGWYPTLSGITPEEEI